MTWKDHIKQLVILSGKGGTGKTSLCAGLIDISSKSMRGVFVDADVDAANLVLLTGGEKISTQTFVGGKIAIIDPETCTNCGICSQVCRFDAIQNPKGKYECYQVIDFLCDGCSACVHVCPQNAIRMESQVAGEWYHSNTLFGHLFHAELFPGSENSGKLVTTIKQHARLFAQDHQVEIMIVDGPPGIGCPVISASAGADLALIVTEPGVTGKHDLERIIRTLTHFHIPSIIAINKADLYPEGTQEIHQLASEYGISISVEIPFDPNIPKAMLKAVPITQFKPDSTSTKSIYFLWQHIKNKFFSGE